MVQAQTGRCIPQFLSTTCSEIQKKKNRIPKKKNTKKNKNKEKRSGSSVMHVVVFAAAAVLRFLQPFGVAYSWLLLLLWPWPRLLDHS